jgi:hypothetical protein
MAIGETYTCTFDGVPPEAPDFTGLVLWTVGEDYNIKDPSFSIVSQNVVESVCVVTMTMLTDGALITQDDLIVIDPDINFYVYTLTAPITLVGEETEVEDYIGPITKIRVPLVWAYFNTPTGGGNLIAQIYYAKPNVYMGSLVAESSPVNMEEKISKVPYQEHWSGYGIDEEDWIEFNFPSTFIESSNILIAFRLENGPFSEILTAGASYSPTPLEYNWDFLDEVWDAGSTNFGCKIYNGETLVGNIPIDNSFVSYLGIYQGGGETQGPNVGQHTKLEITVNPDLNKPINPTPAHESTEVDFSDLTLSWENGGGATSYDVYFGNTVLFDEFIFLDNTAETSIEVPYTITGDNVAEQVQAFVGEQTVFNKIDWNDVLYWRVDARDDEDNIVTGDVWSFDPRPPKTTTPSPVDEYDEMTLDYGDFGWETVDIATSYDTYIGTALIPFVNVINSGVTNSITQSDFIAGIKTGFNSYGLADYGSTYYWRVDPKNLFGVTEGDTWTFTTLPFLPPLDLHAEYGISWYALSTRRSLVTCARNKVWYEE